MKNEAIDKLFSDMSAGIVPDFFAVLSALNEVPELMTLDQRPSAGADPATTCDIYRSGSCSD